jgi:hypothetical protein
MLLLTPCILSSSSLQASSLSPAQRWLWNMDPRMPEQEGKVTRMVNCTACIEHLHEEDPSCVQIPGNHPGLHRQEAPSYVQIPGNHPGLHRQEARSSVQIPGTILDCPGNHPGLPR